MCEKLSSLSQSRYFLSGARLTAVLVLLLALGMTPPCLQSSEPSSNNNNGTLSAWDMLLNEGQRALQQQKESLEALRTEISSLRIGSAELTILYEQLSASNETLLRHNDQILTRLQDRDMQLFWLYVELDAQDELIARQRRTIRTLGGILLGGVILLGVFIGMRLKTGRFLW